MAELKLSMIINENPHLQNAIDRSNAHPLNRKNAHNPFSSNHFLFWKDSISSSLTSSSPFIASKTLFS